MAAPPNSASRQTAAPFGAVEGRGAGQSELKKKISEMK